MSETMEKAYDHLLTEKDWYEKWNGAGLFTAAAQSEAAPFSAILPPPNVTGSLHMGHALTFTIPDIILRRKHMQKFNVLWLPGLDHAGIATQMVVEKNLRQERRLSKEDLGREKFLDVVWEWKERSAERIVEQVKKLGLTLDWSRQKFTLSDEMKEAVTRVFVELYDEGKIYRGTYMVNHCPSCKTVLSDLEVDHKEVQGKLTYIRYPLADDPQRAVVVATTRPETMLGDMAVAVHPDDPRYTAMVGKHVTLPLTGRTIPVVADPEIDKEFGTGAVKITPAHDPLDFQIAQRHGLEQLLVIDTTAHMTDAVPEKYRGMERFACRKAVLEDLRAAGLVEKEVEHIHNIGHCQRCETVVEPNISRQWFLRMKELAAPAIEKVENGEIAFIPDKWKKVYFNWMHNIQDWCISRQLWWGHRIPAYYCPHCHGVTVAAAAPAACRHCGAAGLTQDEDVLDTWFSSALWPFTTLGWHQGKADFSTFYPTSLMATGFDIIFFWVARMIVMGLHFGHDVPFREVLINGLIRDEKGQKMSKTKNNVIDPLELIREYGADALRFTLAIQAVPGMDIALSVNRVKGYRAFANKIWNASRYVIMNLKGDETLQIDPAGLRDTDRWVLHGLNQLVVRVNELMDAYKIHEAADLLYHFIWDEYCDWYLEFSKNDHENPVTRCVLKYSLFTLMQLLHPFMPFISEEIYQRVRGSEEYLLKTEYPSFRHEFVFPEEFARVEWLKKVIAETRKTRTENKIEPNKKIRVFLKPDGERESRALEEYGKYFDFLTRSLETRIVADFSGLPKGFRGVSQHVEILLPFDSDEDRCKELERLKHELEKLQGQIRAGETKLANSAFVERAPAEIVQNLKQTLQDNIEKRNRIQKTIHDLS